MPLSKEKVNGRQIWLGVLCGLLLLMIGIGGITRLTRSGLSIVEWNVVMGTLPPLSEEAWVEQYNLYKQTPESQKVNSSFELSDYKRIFFWEYLHRLLGRVIFFWALFPGLFLVRKRQASISEVAVFSGMVAFQGFLGWFMVKSGLVHLPRVSPYRLTIHYLAAVTILAITYFCLLRSHKKGSTSKSSDSSTSIHKIDFRSSGISGVLLAFQITFFIQLFYGGLTAGLKAGFTYNSFPLMAGTFWPPQAFVLDPWFVNLFENVSTVQWIHRWTAFLVLTLAGIMFFQLRATGHPHLRKAAAGVLHVCSLQLVLGLLTLLFGVPIWLAVLHQVLAAVLVLMVVRLLTRVQEIKL